MIDSYELEITHRVIMKFHSCSTFSDGHGSVSHTRSKNGWWKVTLEEVSFISHIDIYNRMDCCQHRLKNAKVFLDDTLVGTIPQVWGTQKYTIMVKKPGKEHEIFRSIYSYFKKSHWP